MTNPIMKPPEGLIVEITTYFFELTKNPHEMTDIAIPCGSL